MIISRTVLRLETPEFPVGILQDIGTQAYDSAEVAASESIPVQPYGTRVEISQGSLGVVATIFLGAHIAIAFLGGYVGFWDGVEKLKQHGKAAGYFFRDRFRKSPLVRNSPILTTQIGSGDLGKLERIHRQVAQNTMSAQEAVDKAIQVFEKAGDTVDDEVRRALKGAFKSIPPGSAPEPVRQHTNEGRAAARERQPARRRTRRRLIITRLPGALEPTSEFFEE